MSGPKKAAARVVERKLGRHNVHGLCHADGLIEIDSRLRGRKRLEVLAHELLHHACPYLDEEAVDRAGKILSQHLWADRWRRVDNDPSP